jgi:ubiquinone/menaquinone biosynthesis C-methylase UbiE
MRWLTPNPRPFQTALAMIGAKPGSQVLVVGAGDGRLAAAVAGVTGLNGRTLVIDPSAEAHVVVDRAAAEAGVLVEFETSGLSALSAASNVFDVTVVNQRGAPAAAAVGPLLDEAVRVAGAPA